MVAHNKCCKFYGSNFGFLKGRRLAISIAHVFPNCFYYRFKVAQQVMATLPNARTISGRPFKQCGVDYMGPVGVASRTGRAPIITKLMFIHLYALPLVQKSNLDSDGK